jgi:hypothetical protein
MYESRTQCTLVERKGSHSSGCEKFADHKIVPAPVLARRVRRPLPIETPTDHPSRMSIATTTQSQTYRVGHNYMYRQVRLFVAPHKKPSRFTKLEKTQHRLENGIKIGFFQFHFVSDFFTRRCCVFSSSVKRDGFLRGAQNKRTCL